MSWQTKIHQLQTAMEALHISNGSGSELPPDNAYSFWRDLTFDIRSSERSIYLIGNGASASMASHMAADLAKNAHVHTEVFSDLSLITAISNDISFDEVFSEPLRRRMKKHDMLVAISSSGCSPNVLRAVETANGLGGISVTLSAMNTDNPLRSLGTLNWYVPVTTYGLAETCHAAILHHWMDLVSAQPL